MRQSDFFQIINNKIFLLAIVMWTSWVSTPFAKSDGSYELSWYTIDGGGGRSSGGDFTLAGTIGQPDAAYSAGGGYELLGGF